MATTGKAEAATIKFCFYCKKELDRDYKSCPHCGVFLATPANPYFTSPDYVYYQKQDVLEQNPKKKDDPDFMKGLDKAMTDWGVQAPLEDRLGALYDSMLYMSTCLHAPIPTEIVKKMTAVGKQIGRLAESVENYFKNGGEPYDREIGRVPTDTGDDFRSDEAIN